MKHVFVLETPDESGQMSFRQVNMIEKVLTEMVSYSHGICFVVAQPTAESAISAVHELYNAPE